MSFTTLGATAGIAAVVAACAIACSTETIIQQGPAADAGVEAASETGAPACTPGTITSCACANGESGQQTCTGAGDDGPCQCVATPLDKHTVISRSAKSFIEAETHLAAAPDGALCSAWISVLASGSSDIGYAFTRDGGATWTTPLAVNDPSGRDSSDPVVAADAMGNFYVTWISFRRGAGGDASDFVLYVAKAPAGQDKFNTPVRVDTFPSGDKPWITVTAAGTILATVMERPAGESVLYAHRSVNGGATWTRTEIFTSTAGGQANFVVPCAPKSGSRVWATHLTTEGASGFGQRLHWSDDDGVTWPVANSKLFADGSSIGPATCVAKGSDVWVGYGKWTAQPADQEAPVDEYHVMHTSNGATLGDVLASDAATKQQNLGALAIDDASGELALTYYAGNSDGATGSVRSVRSKDSGKTWGKSAVVSAPLLFTADRASQKWLGDYVGTVLRGGALFVTYGENADQFTHVAFSKTP